MLTSLHYMCQGVQRAVGRGGAAAKKSSVRRGGRSYKSTSRSGVELIAAKPFGLQVRGKGRRAM